MLTALSAAGESPISALTGGATLGSFSPNGVQQAQARALEDFQDRQQGVRDRAQARSDALERETDRFIRVQAQINNATVAIDNGLESLDEIETLINEMKGLLGEMERNPDSTFNQEQYDEKLRDINIAADLYGANFNPIGRVADRLTWEPNTISYRASFTSTETDLTGVYAGADYHIEADDGTIWIPDLGASILEQYTSYNTENPENSDTTGQFTSTINGVDSVSGPDGDGKYTFTVNIGGSTETITGTVNTGGLGIMGSFFRNGLTTEEERAAALEELNAADSTLTFARAQLERHRTTIENDLRNVQADVDLIQDEQRENLFDQLEEEQELQVEFQQQIEALSRNIEAMNAQQANYASVFTSFLNTTNNPLFVDTSV